MAQPSIVVNNFINNFFLGDVRTPKLFPTPNFRLEMLRIIAEVLIPSLSQWDVIWIEGHCRCDYLR